MTLFPAPRRHAFVADSDSGGTVVDGLRLATDLRLPAGSEARSGVASANHQVVRCGFMGAGSAWASPPARIPGGSPFAGVLRRQDQESGLFSRAAGRSQRATGGPTAGAPGPATLLGPCSLSYSSATSLIRAWAATVGQQVPPAGRPGDHGSFPPRGRRTGGLLAGERPGQGSWDSPGPFPLSTSTPPAQQGQTLRGNGHRCPARTAPPKPRPRSGPMWHTLGRPRLGRPTCTHTSTAP